MDVDILEARLITKDELIHENIGCSIADNRCSNAPEFIYYTTYWTGSFDNETDVWYINNETVEVTPVYNEVFRAYDYSQPGKVVELENSNGLNK